MGLLDRKDPTPRSLCFVCGNALKFASQFMCKVTGNCLFGLGLGPPHCCSKIFALLGESFPFVSRKCVFF